MDLRINKYWLYISLLIVMNILVFAFLSKKLENYVFYVTTEKYTEVKGI